eukprot:GHUV01033413.1.p1 GENE.GHUV01033413.1~~GHUV01033413.1.p1  ORF type:complete len:148 (-),score=38.52 GHUV01033413.1:612-1001(-)
MTGGDKMFSMRNCPGFSTPAFRSPESLTSGYQPSFEMDMWALGVCIYMWVFGCLPFTGVAPYIIYEKIRAQEIYMPPAPDVSTAVWFLGWQVIVGPGAGAFAASSSASGDVTASVEDLSDKPTAGHSIL